jgi:hypothetical protein
MSLTSFLGMPEVVAKIKPLRPRLPRKIAAPLRAEPQSKRYPMIGTAFDYLLRFELQRRAPHAVGERWIAEEAPDMLWKQNEKGGGGFDLLTGAEPDLYIPPQEVGRLARQIVEEAKAAVAAYLKAKAPEAAQQAELAAHAIRLAKLDEVSRSLRLDPRFREADPEDVQDLLTLLSIVPFDSLLHSKVMLLNPSFGETSVLLGGADTDLITGDLLVDFKTTKASEMPVAHLDQLLGYYLLARHRRRSDPTFPVINRLALYFARHGFLWVQEATTWTDHPQFLEVEEWFFKRAKEASSPNQDAGASPPNRLLPEPTATQPHERKGSVVLLCPSCKKKMMFPAAFSGLKAKCPWCRAIFEPSSQNVLEA